VKLFAVVFGFWAVAQAQVSPSGYRVLGQTDLIRNGVNRVNGAEMNSPLAVAIDNRGGEWHFYASDTLNHRVLGWRNARSYQNGDAPEVVLGQPSPRHSTPFGIGAKSFNQPGGLAVDPATGDLFVGDTGNHRVLRFSYPFLDNLQVEPSAVYGQADFGGRAANAGGVRGNTFNQPMGVAFDAGGNLWVADSANHRLLRFNAGSLQQTNPEADLVLGQDDFTSNRVNRGRPNVSGGGLDTPFGLAFDGQGNLFVSDANNARVLRFNAPLQLTSQAVGVFGQPDLTSRLGNLDPSLAVTRPVGLAVGGGNLYIAVPREHRVVVFDAGALPGGAARSVFGQNDMRGTQINAGSAPLASSRTLAGPSDVKLDPDGNIYIADTLNHRAIMFPNGSRSAVRLWGQNDFSTNGPNQVKAGSINSAYKIAIDYSRQPFALYVSDTNNHRVLGWRNATAFHSGDPADLVIGQPDFSTAHPNIESNGTQPSSTTLFGPRGIAVDGGGNLYVADSGNHRVLRYRRPFDQSGRINADLVIGQRDFQTASSAAVNAASLRDPAGVAIGPEGTIFVADAGNHRVLEFPPDAGNRPLAIRVLGQPNFTAAAPLTPASAQTMRAPQGIFVDAASTLYVADTGNNRMLAFANTREAPQAGAAAVLVIGQPDFSSVAPGAGANRLRTPGDVMLDGAGSIYVADTGNHRVLIFPSLLFVPLSGGAASQVIGQRDLGTAAANWNSTDGSATPEGLFAPIGLLVDRRHTLYVGDTGNNRVVHFLKPAVITHAANAQAGVPLARGGVVTITGGGFVSSGQTSDAASWPLALAGREVVIADQVRAPLGAVESDRVQLQIPAAAPVGPVRLALRTEDTGELIAGGAVTIASVSPGLYSGVAGLSVLNQEGGANNAANPALKGSVVRIFGTGQGPVSPAVPDGEAAPEGVNTVAVPTTDGNTCQVRQPSICVAIGNTFAEVQFSGLAPGMIGVWELRVRVPAGAPSGNAVPVRALLNGTPTNIVPLAIR
jgi:uncharacterized protein (TIGR03437 family)